MLPESRNTNYGPDVAVKSADLNDLQDCVIIGKHGPLWVPITQYGIIVDATISNGDNFNLWFNGGLRRFRGVSNKWIFQIPMRQGQRLLAVKAKVQCDVTDVVRLGVWYQQPDTVTPFVQLGGNDDSAGHANAIEDLDVTGLSEVSAPATNWRTYFAQLSMTAYASASGFVHGVFAQIDCP